MFSAAAGIVPPAEEASNEIDIKVAVRDLVEDVYHSELEMIEFTLAVVLTRDMKALFGATEDIREELFVRERENS
jgi:hypothetical protein